MKKQASGFTLIELIILIAILSVLSIIAIPKFNDYTTNSKHTVCIQQRRLILEQYLKEISNNDYKNKETLLENITQNVNTQCFDGNPECPLDINHEGFEIRRNEDNDFALYCKYHDDQIIVYGKYLAYLGYDFSKDTIQDVLDDRGILQSGWYQGKNSIYSSGGYLFIPNDNEEYSISVDAKLTNTNGYGVLFDTTVNSNNKDTGLVFQFNPGLGKKLIIRERTNGKESQPVIRVSPVDENADTYPNDWWQQKHNIKLQVEKNNIYSAEKNVSVYIDGQEMLTYQYTNTNPGIVTETYTGFRAWNGNNTQGNTNEIYSVQITPN